VISFFVIFFVSLGVSAMALALTGLDLLTAFSGAAAALANIGPGLGEVIGPSGNYSTLSDSAKWILAFHNVAWTVGASGRLHIIHT